MSDNANAGRGFVPEDMCFFSDAALSLLRRSGKYYLVLELQSRIEKDRKKTGLTGSTQKRTEGGRGCCTVILLVL